MEEKPAVASVVAQRGFRSDNNAGLCPEALAALTEAAGGHVVGYGDDVWTARAVEAFRAIFGADVFVHFVATGTAANTLAAAALTEPWNRVVCHRHSHWNDDESTAPERMTGCRTTTVDGSADRITPDDLERVVAAGRGDVHQPQAGVVTLTNATEFGTVYRPGEVRELAEIAHRGGYAVHMDGARFANAVAGLGVDPRELTAEAGVDALSFGGTKNGLALGEAIVLFPQGDGERARRADTRLPFLRKASGHLLSKHRYVAAPFAATLHAGGGAEAPAPWLTHAAHANAMARRLADGLAARGFEPAFAVEANGVFVAMPPALDSYLQSRGHGYYPFGDPEDGLLRLMASFDTQPADVDALLADVDGWRASA